MQLVAQAALLRGTALRGQRPTKRQRLRRELLAQRLGLALQVGGAGRPVIVFFALVHGSLSCDVLLDQWYMYTLSDGAQGQPLQHKQVQSGMSTTHLPALLHYKDGDADGAGLEVDRRLPQQEDESDASDASDPAAGKHVLQRNGRQQPADAAPAEPEQQDSDGGSSEDEPAMPDSGRRVRTWHPDAAKQSVQSCTWAVSHTGSCSHNHVLVLTCHHRMLCSGAPPPLPAPKQPRQLSGEEQRAALAALRKELGLTGGPLAESEPAAVLW